MLTDSKILIVGAGLAGLALARALKQEGFTSTIFERDEEHSRGVGILLTGNAMNALDALGLGAEVRRAGRHVASVQFSEANGSPLFRLEIPKDWPDFVCIHHARLRRILIDSLEGATPQWACTVDQLESLEPNVRVSETTGKTSQYDLLVGADGVHSRIAHEILEGPDPEPLPDYRGWRFIVRRPPDLTEPHYFIGNGRTLLLHPLPDDQVYCGAGPIHRDLLPRDARDADDRMALLSAFADFASPARDVLEQVDASTELIPTRYWQIERQHTIAKNALVIGDAAHACPPTLAQGGAMALEDGLVLAQILAASDSIEEALRAFEKRRRSRINFVRRESLARIQANVPTDDRRCRLRNQIVRQTGLANLQNAWKALVTTAP